jgi:hypothetical protein
MIEEVFLWEIRDDYPERLIGEYQRDVSPDRFLYKKGKAIPEDLPSPVFRFSATTEVLRKRPDLANNAMIPLISMEVAEVLHRHCPNDVQLIPARITAKDGELPGYSIVNATHTVHCIDHERSIYKKMTGADAILSFQRLVCLSGCMGVHALARDEEYLSHLLVRGDLRESLGFLKLLGLYQPSEMSW